MKRINFMVLAALAFSWALLARPLPAQIVYVTNFQDDSISVYSLNPKTGVLTALSGPPFSTGVGDNTVSGYSIDHQTGALTPLSTSPFASGPSPAGIAVDPNGKFAYVTNGSSTTVSGYSLDPLTGALTSLPGSPFGAGSGPDSPAIDPSAQFAYVTNSGDNTVSAYTIDCDGYLSPVAGSPFPTGAFPIAIVITRK
jgi:6-phosphogluconolactonase